MHFAFRGPSGASVESGSTVPSFTVAFPDGPPCAIIVNNQQYVLGLGAGPARRCRVPDQPIARPEDPEVLRLLGTFGASPALLSDQDRATLDEQGFLALPGL